MPGTTYEMSKAGEKSGDAAAVQIKGSFSSELPEKKNWKRNALDGINDLSLISLMLIILKWCEKQVTKAQKATAH